MTDPPATDIPFRRIAVTVPPDGWFHGIAKAMFDAYRQGFVDLGVNVLDVPVEPFIANDPVRIRRIADDLRSFPPDVAIGLPKGSYALLCRMPPRRDGSRLNLFTDVLDVPTICFWDHAPLELVDQLLTPSADPRLSVSGVMAEMRAVMTHPRLVHWSRDVEQTRIMEQLEWVRPGHVVHEMPPCLPGFTARSANGPPLTAAEPRVGFVGHVYQDAAAYPENELSALAGDVIATWIPRWTSPLWHMVTERLDQLGSERRTRLALALDQSYFWRFVHQLTLQHAQTALRLKVIGALEEDVACYGNIDVNRSNVAGNVRAVPGHIPFGSELARILTRHPVTIDVLNPGTIHGYSHKPLLGFASGGFMLLDRKQHFIEAFGDAGRAASYDSEDDLAVKLDRYLGSPALRREVGDAIRERIAERFQLRHVLARVLRAAFARVGSSGTRPREPAAQPRGSVVLQDLLLSLKTKADWNASVTLGGAGALVTTSSHAWAYAASVRIPGDVEGLDEPHVRMRLIVEAGRIGIAAANDDTGSLISEQTVGPTTDPVTLIVELPQQAVGRVFLRTVTPEVTRVRVLELSLCYRVS